MIIKNYVLDFLKKYGSSTLSYACLQDGISYYIKSFGVIAYRQHPHLKGVVAVLSDPICADSDKQRLLNLFCRSFSFPVFYHISFDTVCILLKMGYYFFPMGEENWVHLKSFRYSWYLRRSITRSFLRAKRSGVKFRELSKSELKNLDVNELFLSWSKSKKHPIIFKQFLLQPFGYDPFNNVRYFAAFSNGKMVGLQSFDPLYKSQDVYAYYLNHSYYKPNDISGLSYALSTYVFGLLKEEGYDYVSLGLLPFASLQPFLTYHYVFYLFKFIHVNCDKIFSFQGLSESKRRYRGVPKQVYVSYKHLLLFNLAYVYYLMCRG